MKNQRTLSRRMLGIAFVILGSLVFLATPAFGQAAGTGSGALFTMSSGLFGLPANAVSVDWALLNYDSTTQKITVTVYQHDMRSPRVAVAPGPLQVKLGPTESTHNANSVGYGQPFQMGHYYEVIVETDSLNVLPSVHVWSTTVNEVIPGTLIPPGSWVRLR